MALTAVVLICGMGALTLGKASAANHILVFSKTPNRTDFEPVKGATLSGSVFIFTENLPVSTTEIKFALDGRAFSDEHSAPFDFATTAAGGTPKPFNVSSLSNGQHQITYDLYYGSGKVAHNTASFTVSQSSTITAPPTTPTTRPSSTTPSTFPSTSTSSDAANARQIGVIGDSLTYENGDGEALITKQLESQGWLAGNIKVDGKNHRAITSPIASCPNTADKASPYTESVINDWRAQGFDPKVWLIALGTNNAYDSYQCWQTEITDIAGLINSGPAKNYQIYWMGIGFENDNAFKASSNQIAPAAVGGTIPNVFQAYLNSVASKYNNLTTCDYDTWLSQFRNESDFSSLWMTDGIHPLNDAAYNKLRVPFYGRCVGVLPPATTTPPTTSKPSGSTTTPSKPSATGGGSLSQLVSAAGNNLLTVGNGTYTFSDFSQSNTGVNLPSGGIEGAGIGNTILEMKPNTSTKASLVPTQPTKYTVASAQTNPLALLRVKGSPVLSGFTLQGTAQGHLYNGLVLSKTTNARISNVLVSSVPGSSDVPPGETAEINDWDTTGSIYNNIETNGANTAALGFASNGSKNLTITNGYFHDSAYSHGASLWQTQNATITNTKSVNNYDTGFNFERVTGTVTMRGDTTGNDKLADIRIGNDQGSAVYNIYDPVYSGANLVIMLTPQYNGTTNLQKQSDIHVYVNGVDKTASIVRWKTSWSQAG